MRQRKPRLIAALPGAAHLKPLLAEFAKKGGGTVTSLRDGRLRPVTRMLPEGSSVDTKPFGVVVGEYLMLAQGASMPLAQKGHVGAAVAEACRDLPEDSPFFNSARFPGTHRKIASALDELRSWRVTGEVLLSLAEKTEGALSAKLRSLAAVEADVDLTLRGIFRERNADRVSLSLGLVPESTDVRRLLVLCGSHVTPLEADWLSWAVASGTELWLVIDRCASPDILFQSSAGIADLVKTTPEDVGTPNRLLANLFSPNREEGTAISVEITSAADPLAECEWALRGVSADLENDIPPERIAIFSRDADTYIPLLESAAKRLGVTISCSRQVPLLSNSFAKLTLDVVETCAGSDVRNFSKVIGSSYLQMDRDTRKTVHDAIMAAYLSGEMAWNSLETWSREHEADVQWMAPLLAWRRTALAEPAPLTVWCDRLVELGGHPWHEEALKDSATSVRDGYAQSALQRSLAQFATVEKVRQGSRMSLAQFTSLARSIWSEAEVSTPSTYGSVEVVSSTEQLGDLSSLYVLGMLEGVFPRRRSEDPILTDDERATISGLLGGTPMDSSHAKAFREREEFYRLCGAPSEKICFSYPQTDEDRDNVRAFYLTEVERAMGGEIAAVDHKRTSLAPLIPQFAADVELAESLRADRIKALPNLLATSIAINDVRAAADAPIEPSDLTTVLDCPFKYLGERNLDLAPNRRRSRWYQLFGLPKKTALSTHASREAAEYALNLALDSLLASLQAEAPPHDLALIRSGGARLIQEWLDREFASRALWPRQSVQEEPSFQDGDLRSKLKADDGTVTLKGRYPALSQRSGYNVLHLFRASEPWDENASREDDPWNRLKVREQFELGLLLISLCGKSDKVGIEVDSASGGRNLFLMPRPEETFRSDQINGFRVTALDRDQRRELSLQVGDNVRKAIRRIKLPMVEATPNTDLCRTCEYGELCRRSAEFSEEVDPFGSDDLE